MVDLLLRLKFDKLPIFSTLSINFILGRLAELMSGYLGFKGNGSNNNA